MNPYLNFSGTSEEAFNFYKSVFGGEFTTMERFKNTPDGDKLSPEDANKIMHIALPIGGNTLMATDALESMGQTLTQGNNFHLSIHTESKAEADKLFSALGVGGKVEMPLMDMFWGAYFGMLNDKFGIKWIVSYEPKK